MKRVYFAGKFNKKNNSESPLHERLKNDYRSIILGDSKKLTYAQKDLKLTENIIYNGPFYCETASNGDFTSTDCKKVLNEEYKSVKNSDIYVVVFGDKFAAGSVVELGWALEMNKEIIIFYKNEENSPYAIKSEYWFPITNAMLKTKRLKVFKYKEIEEVIDKIKEGKLFKGGMKNEI